MGRHNNLLMPFLLTALSLLAACVQADAPATATPKASLRLEGSEWVLASLRGKSLLEGSRITINLDGDRFEGLAGCNNYGGQYAVTEEGRLRISEIFVTAMACPSPQGIMEQEMAYIQALGSSATLRLVDGRLEMASDSDEMLLLFDRKAEFDTDGSALLGTVWRLASIDGESFSGGSTFTLAFYNETILGSHAGCRDYLATYQVSGDDLNLLFEAMFDADCRVEDAQLEQEAQFLGIMAPKSDLRLGIGQLEIHGERGGLLLFEPLPEEANLDLEGPTWSLLAFVGPNPYAEAPEPWPVPNGLLAGTTIDLTFAGHAARGSAGCNSYGAGFSRAGSSLGFETLISTEMACLDPPGVMGQEAHYLELLAAVTGYHIYGDRLWLDTGDGQALVFFATAR